MELGINENYMRKMAPAIYGTPSENVSRRYVYVPTHEVLSLLSNEGFYPTKVIQTGYKNSKTDHSKHMIRLRHENDMIRKMDVGGLIPEIVLINSHDAKSSFKIMSGLFRLVCSNGMIVPQGPNQKNVIRHFGSAEEVVDAVFNVVKTTPLVMNNAMEMTSIDLTPDERGVFAKAAVELRWPMEKHPNVNRKALESAIITPRRNADVKSDLWTTFSIIQENMTKGGMKVWAKKDNKVSRRKAKGITAINEDIRLNKSLWILAEEMKKLKG